MPGWEHEAAPQSSRTARSGFPSLLKSPTATATGAPLTAKVMACLNVPSPTPGSIETVLSRRLTATISSFSSPFTSASATDTGPAPTLHRGKSIHSVIVCQKYRHASSRVAGNVGTAVVGNHQAGDFVAIQIAGGDGDRLLAGGVRTGGFECAVANSQRKTHGLRRIIDDCQIDMTVPIKGSCHGGNWRIPGDIVS